MVKPSPPKQRFLSKQLVASQPNLSRPYNNVSKRLKKIKKRTTSRIFLPSNLRRNKRLMLPKSAKKVKTIVAVRKEKTWILIKLTPTMMTK